MMNRSRKEPSGRSTLRWVVLLSMVLAAGCGDDGGGGGGPTATPTDVPTVVPTVGPTPIPPRAGAGLTSEILAVDVGPDPAGAVAVTFSLTDESGIPLKPTSVAVTNDQEARARFTIAHVENYSGGGEFDGELTRYVNDIDQTTPRYDRNGTFEVVDAAAGIYRYLFMAQLPAGSDLSRTYTVGLQVDRTVDGVQLSANPIFDLVPAGGVPQIRAGSTTAQCNSCHDPLRLHGNRREFRLCTLCHTQAAMDENGTTIDFSVMVHKIHAGKELPSIVDGPPGATYAIGDAVFAMKDLDGKITGVGFPRSLQECATCHSDGATAEHSVTQPSAAACTSCHDDVNPSLVTTAAGPPGTKHLSGRGFADGDCRFCHTAETEKEFDISIPGAHVIPERSEQLQGLVVEIVGVANHGAGETPVVTFKVTNDAGEVLRDLSGLNRLAFALAGPTTDYRSVTTPTAVGGGSNPLLLSGPDEDGLFEFTFPAPLPSDAMGTWSLGAEARRSVTLATAEEDVTKTVNEAAVNPVVTFTTDDSTAEPRRVVTEDAKCQNCHGEFSRGFSIHGNLRNQIEYCVLCHNPNASDVARRSRDAAAVARGEETATIDFKVMIHKIHTGEELEQQPYVIYGFGAPPANFTAIDFGEVLFPGDRRHCQTCHAEETYLLPPYPGTALGTQMAHLDPATGREVVDGRRGAVASVCVSCHDGDDTAAHVATQTAPNGDEACTVCHSEDREFSVSSSHARPGLD